MTYNIVMVFSLYTMYKLKKTYMKKIETALEMGLTSTYADEITDKGKERLRQAFEEAIDEVDELKRRLLKINQTIQDQINLNKNQ